MTEIVIILLWYTIPMAICFVWEWVLGGIKNVSAAPFIPMLNIVELMVLFVLSFRD